MYPVKTREKWVALIILIYIRIHTEKYSIESDIFYKKAIPSFSNMIKSKLFQMGILR